VTIKTKNHGTIDLGHPRGSPGGINKISKKKKKKKQKKEEKRKKSVQNEVGLKTKGLKNQ